MSEDRMKLQCLKCHKNFIATRNTEKCPHCGDRFPDGNIASLFNERETQLANNKFYRAGKAMSDAGDGMIKTGSGMQSLGCGMTLLITIPLLIILYLLFF